MLFLSLVPLLLSTILAQTPDGFTPKVVAKLDVVFAAAAVTPGLALAKTAVAAQPTIGTSNATLNGTYLFVMLDLDVPGQYAGLPAGQRAVNLHAMISGFKSNGKTVNGSNTLASIATTPASYLAPGPPAETPAHPHKYVELLYEQPASFAVPSTQTSAISKRIGFNITAFETAASLGAPVRANYFTVQG